MFKEKKILALVPARGGSKGIRKKNIAPCAGRPLISYTLEAALGCPYLDEIIVSTDDQETAQVCQNLGVKVDHLRPVELSQDDTPAIDVMKYEVSRLEGQGLTFDLLVYLQPTSPLRTVDHLNEAIEFFLETSQISQVDSLVSVVRVPHQFVPESVMKMGNNGLLKNFLDGEKTYRRQEKPEYFARNGAAIYIFLTENIKRSVLFGEHCLPYIMSYQDSLDIDESADLDLAQLLLERRTLAKDGPVFS